MMSDGELVALQRELNKQNPQKEDGVINNFISHNYMSPLEEQAFKLAQMIGNGENNQQIDH